MSMALANRVRKVEVDLHDLRVTLSDPALPLERTSLGERVAALEEGMSHVLEQIALIDGRVPKAEGGAKSRKGPSASTPSISA